VEDNKNASGRQVTRAPQLVPQLVASAVFITFPLIIFISDPVDDSSWFFSIFIFVGAFILVSSIRSYAHSRNREKVIAKITSYGHKTTGIVIGINHTSTSNSVKSYKVTVTANNSTGQAQNFTSDTIVDEAIILSIAQYKTIPIAMDVYIDPADPKKYYVDVDSAPTAAPANIQQLVEASQDLEMLDSPPPSKSRNVPMTRVGRGIGYVFGFGILFFGLMFVIPGILGIVIDIPTDGDTEIPSAIVGLIFIVIGLIPSSIGLLSIRAAFLSRKAIDLDNDGIGDDGLPATPEQLRQIEAGFRDAGQFYMPRKKMTQGEAREILRNFAKKK
jgi:hypothetical protein